MYTQTMEYLYTNNGVHEDLCTNDRVHEADCVLLRGFNIVST